MLKVSVLLPVYNAAPYLKEAIDSILAQSFTEFEFLIINDGSTDTSDEIINSYKDSRISYIKNKRNLGLVETLNLGIGLAQSEYIARMDADDISLPERLSRQISFLDSRPKIGACGTAYRYFGDRDYVESLPSDAVQAFTLLAYTACLGHPTSMIRKSVLNEHGIRYEHKFGYAADYALWIRMSRVSDVCSLAEPLLLYRWHSSSMSRTHQNRLLARAEARILWYELFLGGPIEKHQREYLRENLDDWNTFVAGKELILKVLKDQKTTSCIDLNYYGKLVATDWEVKIINSFGLKGLLTCLFSNDFKRWSRIKRIGLIPLYLARFSIKSKR